MPDLKEKIYEKMKEPAMASLATVTEDGKPWVRYCTPFMDPDMNIWMSTFANSRKLAQIKKNPEVHLTAGVIDPKTAEYYLQIQGRAELLTDAKSKQFVWFAELGAVFSGPDDPNFVVLKIIPYRIEVQPMAPAPPEVWEA